LTDPGIEEAIRAFVATAPPLPEDCRSRLARLLRTSQCRDDPDDEDGAGDGHPHDEDGAGDGHPDEVNDSGNTP
jgi:hypothetical protein